MQRIQTCQTCGASLNLTGMALGAKVACGACKSEVTVGRTRAGAAPAPSRAPASQYASSDSREKSDARARFKAARLCSTSLYCCFAIIPVFLFLGVLGSVVLGVLAIVTGAIGLSSLNRVGRGGRREIDAGGMVRSSVRIAASAPTKAWIGISIGGAAVVGSVILFVLALKEAQRQREEERFAIEQFERYLRDAERIRDSTRRVRPVEQPEVPAEDDR